MTENVGTCTRCWPGDPDSSGTVGPPQASVEVKLVDVPSMSYFATDKPNPRGEVCCRGPGVFTHYHEGRLIHSTICMHVDRVMDG
jgi:long-chain acyl-CoA synthetase